MNVRGHSIVHSVPAMCVGHWLDTDIFAMSRSIRDGRLEFRNSRAKLKIIKKPYFTILDVGLLHLGYRRSKDGGKWIVRRYLGERRYDVNIATADDRENARRRRHSQFQSGAGARAHARARPS